MCWRFPTRSSHFMTRALPTEPPPAPPPQPQICSPGFWHSPLTTLRFAHSTPAASSPCAPNIPTLVPWLLLFTGQRHLPSGSAQMWPGRGASLPPYLCHAVFVSLEPTSTRDIVFYLLTCFGRPVSGGVRFVLSTPCLSFGPRQYPAHCGESDEYLQMDQTGEH